MSYTQKDFIEQIKGITPSQSSLLVSFSNLLERLGKEPVSPISIEAFMLDRGINQLIPESISKLCPDVYLSSSGINGQPLRNDAIMKFEYRNAMTNEVVDHYCLVKDAVNGIIVDSYSGIEKSWDVYGGAGPWYVYIIKEPTVATPDGQTASVESKLGNFAINNSNVATEPQNEPNDESVTDLSNTLPTGNDAVIIPVKHKPVDPLSWQATYRPGLGVLDTVAIKNIEVEDLAGELPNKELIAGTKVPVAGRFEKDGKVYYRTVKSVEDGVWYGVPAGSIIRAETLDNDDDIQAIYESPDETTKEKVIKNVAKIEGKTKRLFSFGRKR